MELDINLIRAELRTIFSDEKIIEDLIRNFEVKRRYLISKIPGYYAIFNIDGTMISANEDLILDNDECQSWWWNIGY